jgi:hypothetical protein
LPSDEGGKLNYRKARQPLFLRKNNTVGNQQQDRKSPEYFLHNNLRIKQNSAWHHMRTLKRS